MDSWSPEEYIKAWNFASAAHTGQEVPGSRFPYINHLGLVAMETMAAISRGKNIDFPDLLVQCALLHDTIEDTQCTYEEIDGDFGKQVADGVLALLKKTALSTKEAQMKDSIERIKRQPREVWMVKMSDRITNLQPPPNHWDVEKIDAYRSEAALILNELGAANGYLAERLEMKTRGYAAKR